MIHRWINTGTTLCYRDIVTDIESARKYGFEALELKYNWIKDLNIHQIKMLLTENEVLCGSIGSIVVPAVNDNSVMNSKLELLKQMCELANVLECKNIVAFDDINKNDLSISEKVENTRINLQEYSNIAAYYDMNIVFEPMAFENSAIKDFFLALEIVSSIDAPNIGMLLDFYHYINSGLDLKRLYSVSAEKITMVHICDGIKSKNGLYDDYERLWLGEGDFQIDRCKEVLQIIHYSNSISLEVFKRNGWEFSHGECIKQIKRNMDSFCGV